MNYTLSQLTIFLKVVENQSITKAAAELLLTQPAVSIQLKNFQSHFDLFLYKLSYIKSDKSCKIPTLFFLQMSRT